MVGALAVSFLKLATYEHESAVRAALYSSSLNLAESGVEIAVEALASGSITASTWTKFEKAYLQDRGYSGDIRVVILDARSTAPTIYSEGIVRGHPSGDVKKQVRVTLSSGFAPFAYGFSARNGISFSGNGVLLNSYNSKFGAYEAPLNLLDPEQRNYGHLGLNKNDDIYVSSDLIEAIGLTAVDQGNADVYGYVTVSPGNFASIGPQGVVTSYGNGAHDPSRVLGDFYADFPVEAHPSGSYSSDHSRISGATTVNASNDPDSPTYYDVSSISLSGNPRNVLTVKGHAVFVMSGDISVTGNASITVASGGSLRIYSQDDIDIGGNGIVNTDMVPSDVYIVGTAPDAVDSKGKAVASQSIKIHGNGQLSSVLYAPNADVTLNGGGNSGQVMGGVVAFKAAVTGGSSFHFDEALRDEVWGGGIYSIDSWLEMTGATTASTRKDLANYF